MQDTIKLLEDKIQSDIDAIKNQRRVLKAMKAQEKKNIPFSATTFGKLYFSTPQGCD